MKNLIYFLSIAILILNASCSKVENVISPPKTVGPVDVYVVGRKNGHACYWKNNQEVILDNGTMSNSNATKIIVSNGDVYVLGTYAGDIAPTIEYVYWKNGVMTNLTQTLSDSVQRVQAITDMDVSGNDVYFVGATFGSATVFRTEKAYWKNGIKTFIPGTDFTTVPASHIKVVNNNVYIIGGTNSSANKGYFINNNFTPSFQTLNGITVNGLDVYVYGGNFNPSNLYYKNLITGQEVSFFPSNAIAKMVFDGNDRYTSTDAYVFKNDFSVFQRDGFPFDFITDFEVLNSNTYVITQEGDLGVIDKLFINNVETQQINSTFNSNKFNAVTVVQN